MKIGTKSLLFGAHQVILHPIFVFIAWWKLYGFPKDPRLWIAFIVHDWGYWGKPNMDGKEGETHVELGARIMHKLFDPFTEALFEWNSKEYRYDNVIEKTYKWYIFTLFHSRFYAKANNHSISKLCIADKYAFCIPSKWLYMLLVNMSGEIYEYMDVSRQRSGKPPIKDKNEWYEHTYKFMIHWVYEHKDNLNNGFPKNKPFNIDKAKGYIDVSNGTLKS